MTPVSVSRMSAAAEADRITAQGQVGIIAGSGPEAGQDLWTKLLDLRRAELGTHYRGDLDAPQVKILSLPILGLSMDMDRHADVVWPALNRAAEEMANTCCAYTIACNTLHYFADRLKKISGGCFVSVQDTVRDELRSRGTRRVALLGASPVLSLGWSPYTCLRDEFDLELADGKVLDDLIYAVKTVGRSTPELSGELMRILVSMKSEVVVLGCTELPLIKLLTTRHAVVDVTSLLARRLLRALRDSDMASEGGPQ